MVGVLASKTTLIKQIITDELPNNRIILSSRCPTHTTEKVAKKVCHRSNFQRRDEYILEVFAKKSKDKASL